MKQSIYCEWQTFSRVLYLRVWMKLLELTWVHMVMRHQVTELAGLLVSPVLLFFTWQWWCLEWLSATHTVLVFLLFFCWVFLWTMDGSAGNFGALHPEQFHNCKVQFLPLRWKSPSWNIIMGIGAILDFYFQYYLMEIMVEWHNV
jgi:hypothetical protein